MSLKTPIVLDIIHQTTRKENMKLYIVKYEKDQQEYKKVVLKVSNDLSGEEVFYSGFLRDLENERS